MPHHHNIVIDANKYAVKEEFITATFWSVEVGEDKVRTRVAKHFSAKGGTSHRTIANHRLQHRTLRVSIAQFRPTPYRPEAQPGFLHRFLLIGMSGLSLSLVI